MTDAVTSEGLESSPAPEVAHQSPSVQAMNEEKVLTQAQADKIAKEALARGYEKAKREVSAAAAREPAVNTGSMGGMPAVTQEQLDHMIEQRLTQITQSQRQNEYATQFMNSLTDKLNAARALHSDFDEVVSLPKTEQEAVSLAPLFQLANQLDNGGEVLYHLQKNPKDFAPLLVLAHTAPAMAHQEMVKVSKSIQANREAMQNNPAVKPPLSPISPSLTGADGGNSPSISDYRRRYRA